jgi:DNA (cytosine-5)-methyltransferase 1
VVAPKSRPESARTQHPLAVAGLFAGIGGVEEGLRRAGHSCALLCEIDDGAVRVLRSHYPDVPLHGDVRTLRDLPQVDLVAAGFPCQDLSQAGRTAGIAGPASGLVSEVFRLVRRSQPRWLLLENVPFMLALDAGRAMEYLTNSLRRLGYSWAYRVVDSRSFGLPQRRRRVLLLASASEDPRDVMLADEAGTPAPTAGDPPAYGFYWTEGLKGLGWAANAVPTLKGGSTVGIPSPPAIWFPEDGRVGTPDVRDAERLQGFPVDWTASAASKSAKNPRWKLVGNAVSVPLATWVGRRLRAPGRYDASGDVVLRRPRDPWPEAAWCAGDSIHASSRSSWPVSPKPVSLAKFLRFPLKPLSRRATAGFLDRTKRSRLRFHQGFLDAVAAHLYRLEDSRNLFA